MTPDGGINDAFANTGENAGVVLRFLVAFDRRWPTEDELAELVAPDIRFIERPNLINPGESERDAAGLRAGIETGRQPLAWQSYELRDRIVSGDSVVTRMRCGAVSSQSTPALGLPGRVWVEQHDCYEQPSPPES